MLKPPRIRWMKLSVHVRLGILIGVAAIGTLAGLALFLQSLATSAQWRSEFEAQEDMLLVEQTLRAEILEIGRLAERYVIESDSRILDEVARTQAQIEDIAADRAHSLAVVLQDVRLLRFLIDQISTAQMASGLDQGSGLRGMLRAEAHYLEEEFSILDEGAGAPMLVELLQMRRREKDYILREDSRYLVMVNSHIGRLGRLLGSADILEAQREQWSASLIAYRDYFHAWSEQRSLRSDAISAFRAELSDIQRTMAQMSARQAAQVEAGRQAFELARAEQTRFVILMSAMTLLGVVLAGIYVSRSISNPLKEISVAIKDINNADGIERLKSLEVSEELGEMARAAIDFHAGEKQKESFIEQERVKLDAQIARHRALESRIEQFRDDIARQLGEVTSVATAMRDASTNLSGQTSTASERAGEVSNRFVSAAEDINTLQQAVGDLAEAIERVRGQTRDSEEASASVTGQVERAGNQVYALRSAATEISESAHLIAAISGRTNLLALNATIEAARAGESGRGFAIVAGEVKQLSEQTAQATTSIHKQIEHLTEAVSQVAGAMERIQGLSATSSEFVSAVSEAIADQARASDAIGENSRSVSDGAVTARQQMSTLSEAVASSSSVAEQTDQLSDELAGFVQALEAAIDTFLQDVAQDTSKDAKGDARADVDLWGDDEDDAGDLNVELF